MSTKKQSFERRTDKLRASCDACYLAKVKCSKSRPLCQRCLVSGTSCAYSPSARFKRGARTTVGDRQNDEMMAFRIQSGCEPHLESNPPASHFELSSSHDQNFFTQHGRPSTHASTPGTEFLPLGPVSCAEPVLLFHGETMSPCGVVNDFGLHGPWSWWNEPAPVDGNVTEGYLNGSYMGLESSNDSISQWEASWYQNHRNDLNLLSSNNPSMSSSSTQARTFYEEYPPLNSSEDLELIQLNSAEHISKYQSWQH